MTRREALGLLHQATDAARVVSSAQLGLDRVSSILLRELSAEDRATLAEAQLVLERWGDAVRSRRVECERVLVGE